MYWLLCTFFAIACFTTLNILQRKIASDSAETRATSILFNSIAAGLAFLLTVALGQLQFHFESIQWYQWIPVAISVICYGLFERYRFKVAKLLDVSTFSTIISFGTIASLLVSVLFFKELLTPSKIVGCVAILAAVVVISHFKKGRSPAGVLLCVMLSGILGIAWAFDKHGVGLFGPSLYSLMVWILPLIIIIFPGIELKSLRKEIRLSWKPVALSALLNVIGYFFQVQALELAEASRVIPLLQITMIATVLCGAIFLNERQSLGRKFAAALLAIIGVLFLS